MEESSSWVARLGAVPLGKYFLVRELLNLVDFKPQLIEFPKLIFYQILEIFSATHVDTREIVAVKIVSLYPFLVEVLLREFNFPGLLIVLSFLGLK